MPPLPNLWWPILGAMVVGAIGAGLIFVVLSVVF